MAGIVEGDDPFGGMTPQQLGVKLPWWQQLIASLLPQQPSVIDRVPRDPGMSFPDPSSQPQPGDIELKKQTPADLVRQKLLQILSDGVQGKRTGVSR